MAVTYEMHLWQGTDSYKILEGGEIARLRIKKMDDGQHIANLDYDIQLSELLAMTGNEIQTIIDGLIDTDEAKDAREIARKNTVIPAIDTALNARLKVIEAKTKGNRGARP